MSCNNTPTTAITIVAYIGSSPNTSMNQFLKISLREVLEKGRELQGIMI